MSLYRVSGVVEAYDGTSYAPLFFGDAERARRVFGAVCEGAYERGDGYSVLLSVEDSRPVFRGSGGWRVVSWFSGPVRARPAADVPAFEVVSELEVDCE